MKIYYCTRDIHPTDNFHLLNWDANTRTLVPDLVTLLHREFEIIGKDEVRRVRSEFGKDAVSFFEVQSVFTPDYIDHIRTEHSGLDGNCITRFYLKG